MNNKNVISKIEMDAYHRAALRILLLKEIKSPHHIKNSWMRIALGDICKSISSVKKQDRT